MSRKTRKQKIRAQEHKKNMLRKSLSSELTGSTPRVHIPSLAARADSRSSRQGAPRAIRTQEEELNQGYFISDMRKSLFLIAVIIGLEIALYYGTMNSYLASILRF